MYPVPDLTDRLDDIDPREDAGDAARAVAETRRHRGGFEFVESPADPAARRADPVDDGSAGNPSAESVADRDVEPAGGRSADPADGPERDGAPGLGPDAARSRDVARSPPEEERIDAPATGTPVPSPGGGESGGGRRGLGGIVADPRRLFPD